MKTTILGLLAIVFSATCFAQNTNVQQEVKTTTTTIKDSEGTKKVVKKEKTNEVQNIELKDAESKKLNKEMKETPIQVTETTEVTVDGVTKVVDVDRSAYYLGPNNTKYQVAPDKTGYSVIIPNTKRPALLRRTTNDNYIYVRDGKISVGYFDKEGNLILESYDEKTDKMSLEKYVIIKN